VRLPTGCAIGRHRPSATVDVKQPERPLVAPQAYSAVCVRRDRSGAAPYVRGGSTAQIRLATAEACRKVTSPFVRTAEQRYELDAKGLLRSASSWPQRSSSRRRLPGPNAAQSVSTPDSLERTRKGPPGSGIGPVSRWRGTHCRLLVRSTDRAVERLTELDRSLPPQPSGYTSPGNSDCEGGEDP
jgi:hypothetical protein